MSEYTLHHINTYTGICDLSLIGLMLFLILITNSQEQTELHRDSFISNVNVRGYLKIVKTPTAVFY
jgi:hypothetical protein